MEDEELSSVSHCHFKGSKGIEQASDHNRIIHDIKSKITLNRSYPVRSVLHVVGSWKVRTNIPKSDLVSELFPKGIITSQLAYDR